MEQTDRVAHLEAVIASIAERVSTLERRLDEGRAATRPPTTPWVEKVREAAAADDELRSEPAPRKRQVAPPERVRAPKPVRERGALGDVERTVGTRVFAAVGALIVIAAAALFLKLAWDRGWLQLVPDIYKVGASTAFGFLLLGAGEVARRKINAAAAAGLFGAGIGVVYASGYSAYALFHLVGPAGAFASLVGAVALGVLVSARARLASVAVVSLVGGYAAPFLLGDAQSPPATLPAYWLGLLLVGLTLSAWRAGHFSVLRFLVWWGTVVFGAWWVHEVGAQHTTVALGFIATAWALVHAELVIAARFGRLSEAPSWIQVFEPDDAWRVFRPYGASLTLSAWAGALAASVLDAAYALDWLAPAAGFVATAMLALPLVGSLRALRDAPETDLQRLGVVFTVEAGAFLFATIALALAGWLEVAAWLGLGVASLVAGRWIRARGFEVYGLLVLAYGTLRLFAMAWWMQPSMTGVTPLGLVITEGGVLALVTGAAWLVAAGLLRTDGAGERIGARLCAFVGVFLVSLALVHRDADMRTVSVALLGVSIVAYHARRIGPRLSLDRTSAAPLAMATLAWLSAYPLDGWLDRTDQIFAHPGLWLALGIALAGALQGVGVLRRNEPGGAAHGTGALVTIGACLLAFGVTSVEIARSASLVIADETARRAAVSIWWGLLGVACIGAGFRWRLAVVRHTGMGLLGLATAKAVVFDLAFVSPELRVVSFLTLGLLLLGVGVGYARVSARVAGVEVSADAA
ncbi:MAG: DUF2339 domain-containing protein [Phycisphaerales bacterium]